MDFEQQKGSPVPKARVETVGAMPGVYALTQGGLKGLIMMSSGGGGHRNLVFVYASSI